MSKSTVIKSAVGAFAVIFFAAFALFVASLGYAAGEDFEIPAESAAAFVDVPFNPVISGGSAFVARSFIQSDGKIVVTGDFRIINGVNRNGIVRFNADGTLDTSFNPGSGANDAVFGVDQQSSGKLVVSGLFTNFNGVPVGRIVRLNPDGSVDQTFNTVGAGLNSNTGGSAEISEVKVLSDDRLLIGGTFTSYNNVAQNRLARLGPNGSLDSSFVVGSGASSTVLSIDVQSDGKALIGGNFSSYNANPAQRIARINTDGTFDASFTAGAGADFTVRHVSVQPDNKIYAAGLFQVWAGIPRNGLVRLNSDGSVDQTFSVSGLDATVFSVVVQTDGKVVVGGSFTQISGGIRQCIARLNADGTFDPTFDPGTGVGANVIQDLALQSDGKVVLVGTFSVYNGVARGGVARANSDGSLDSGMAVTSSVAGTVNAMAVQTDGKIVIGGLFTAVNGIPRINIARLNADGTLDETFATGMGTSASVQAVAIQSDGSILIGGSFTTYNGTAINRLARLSNSGAIDTGFTTGTGPASDVLSIAIQPSDGKILIGGQFATYNGTAAARLARLNANGTLDPTFVTGTTANGTVRKIVLQTDNRILIGGSFTTYNAVSRNRIARINADGSLDATFNPGTGAGNQVSSVALMTDGKITIGGTFTTFNGVTRNRVARLNADGSLDTSFDPGVGPGIGTATDVSQILPLADGKIIVGGNFSTFNNLPRSRFTRLNANGTLDFTFLNGLGAISTTGSGVRSIILQPDNKILIAGSFSAFNSSSRSGIARFSNASDTTVDFDGDGKSDFAIIRRPGAIGSWTWSIDYSGSDAVSTFNFGLSPRDVPQPGDFDGDGKDDVAVWRDTPLGGEVSAYYIVQSASNTIRIVAFGQSGDVPLTEDYDGDGKDDLSVWRAPTEANGSGPATWFYLGSLSNPNNNITYVPWGMRYGTQTDQVDEPYPGDFDGDGKADFRIQRRSDISVASSNTPATFYTLTAAGNVTYDYYGLKSDRILPGDYDGDGKTDIAVARGFNINPGPTVWYIRYTSGIPDTSTGFGTGFNFAQGDYDGDGKTDIGYFIVAATTEATGFWYLSSRDGTTVFSRWGARPLGGAGSGDFPVASYNNR